MGDKDDKDDNYDCEKMELRMEDGKSVLNSKGIPPKVTASIEIPRSM